MKFARKSGFGRVARVAALAVIAVCLGGSTVHAQDPIREQAFVYGMTTYNGSKYDSTLVPPSVDTIYLLSDRKNLIAPRETYIYFWNITNEYLADWEKLNQLVDGQLQVYQNGQLRATIPLSSYVIQYDVNDPETTLALYSGAEAETRYNEWQNNLKAYQDSLVTYYRALGTWEEEIKKLTQESPDRVIPPDKVPPRPEQPQRPSVLSTNPAQGYVIDLPNGTYDIQVLRADGTLQANSKKRLVMFDKQREGIAYSVVPSIRWNLPEQSDEPDSVIYTVPGTTLYLQAFKAGQYNDYEYSHMLDPQDQASQPDRGKWVSFDPTTKPLMRLSAGGQPVSGIASQPYLVRQISGGGLGYEVVPFNAETMDRSTFTGYPIPMTTAGEEYAVELVDESGNAIPGSQRRVIALDTNRVLLPYATSVLPLLVGVGVLLLRRRQARKIQVDE